MSDRHAWAHDGVEQIAPGIHRIPVGMPGDALEAVNVYALVADGSLSLVDAGWFVPEALADLESGLGALGAGLADVDFVAATHVHPDHYTLAVELRRLTGCPIALGADERDTLSSIIAGERIDDFVAMLARSGVPRQFIDAHLRTRGESHLYELPDTWLQANQSLELGGRVLEVLATPGHTRGHLCFADSDSALLFAGDHVLPHITPSIGFESYSPAHLPLRDYLDSLRMIRKRPDARLLPAHGPVTPSVHARVDQLLVHHEDRLRHCLDALAADATTTYEVACQVPWTRRELAFDDLAPFDRLMATHETRAHLEVLTLQGRASVSNGADVDRYAVA
jgi:glyoxylase-like metal-dependent hydrolase (beta-lactamase superfamily II)